MLSQNFDGKGGNQHSVTSRENPCIHEKWEDGLSALLHVLSGLQQLLSLPPDTPHGGSGGCPPPLSFHTGEQMLPTLHGLLWLPCILATPLSNVSSLNSPVFICLMPVPYLIRSYNIILKIENYMTSIFWQSRNFIWGIWRREWQSTPVFLPGEFHGQRRLAGYSLLGLEESDMTEQLTLLQ